MKDRTDSILRLEKKLSAILKGIAAYRQLALYLQKQYGIAEENTVDDIFYDQTAHDLHIRNPYSSPFVNHLRSVILLKSLEIHEYAILSNAKFFRNNLNLFMDMLAGRAESSPKLSLALWNTLFFCVPVVSTSLASVSRLFPFLGSEDLGWLMLDEAGQASPASAAGIIWRSKRCIIIGDPLQIEPVVTIPAKLALNLAVQNKVDNSWSPRISSVQTLADRVSVYGTYMVTGNVEEKIWAGFPLRAHRRCNDPMFSISNEIAYNGQMVKAQSDEPFESVLGPSAWFHVAGSKVENKQVIREEIDLLKEKIATLTGSGYKGPVFIISPFRAVAKECETVLSRYQNISYGTIHTFQGKEADIVFLVLGSNPASPGARSWASAKPNMLNVGLTRARRRVYVIGNRNLWGNCAYFSILAKI